MSSGKKFSPRDAKALQLHMSANPPRPDDPTVHVAGGAKSPAKATFGPATYYRLGVLTPGGPVKRWGVR